jgi:Tol biopolymer transport system component
MRRAVWLLAALGVLALVVSLCGCGGMTGTARSVGTAGKPPPPPPPTPTPFSPAIAYIHKTVGSPSNSVLCITNSTGTQVKQAPGGASGQGDESPAWSPDGQRVAFLRGPSGAPNKLCMIRPDGTGLTTVWTFNSANGPMPGTQDMDWLPDGSKLLIGGYVSGFFAMDPNTGQIQNLSTDVGGLNLWNVGAQPPQSWNVLNSMGTVSVGPDTDPTTSGFQGLIAYEASSDPGITNGYDVCFIRVATDPTSGLLVRADGKAGGPTAILSLPGNQYGGVEFSSDGRSLAVTTDQAPFLAVVAVTDNGGTDIQFGTPLARSVGTCFSAHMPTWSPDGKWISFEGGYWIKSSGVWGVWRSPNPTGSPAQVSQDVSKSTWSLAPEWNPQWTPDL